jgi:hypothetical protein
MLMGSDNTTLDLKTKATRFRMRSSNEHMRWDDVYKYVEVLIANYLGRRGE